MGSADADVVQPACVAEGEFAVVVDHVAADPGLGFGFGCGWRVALLPYAHNPYAQAPLWERLIARCAQCDETDGTAEFLKRALGYMLVGSNPQQKFFLFVGP